MNQLGKLCVLTALLGLTGCFKFGARIEETVSSRLVMGTLDEGNILQKTQQTTIRIGDREHVASVLTNVFGPTAARAISENITRKPALFGGPCDVQAESVQPDPACGTADIGAAIVPSVTTAREGLRTQTCDRIVQEDAAIRYAAAQVRDLPDGDFSVTEMPTIADIKAAYELFMPGRPLPDDIAAELKNGVVEGAKNSGGSTTESWRFLFLTLCISPQWQIL